MIALLKGILSIIISTILSLSAIGSVEQTPEAAAESFMAGVTSGDDTVVTKYMGNDYVNMLENTGDAETSEKLYEYLFENFSYEIVDTSAKNDVAVAKITIKVQDFSGVMDIYEDEAYEYITSNLYDEDITDKSKLSEKCLEIYVESIKEAAEKKDNKAKETTIYLPMESNGYYGWEVLIDDDIMEVILGGLELPESE